MHDHGARRGALRPRATGQTESEEFKTYGGDPRSRPPVSEKRNGITRKRDTSLVTQGVTAERINKKERAPPPVRLPAAARVQILAPRRRWLGSPTWTTRKHLDWPLGFDFRNCHDLGGFGW